MAKVLCSISTRGRSQTTLPMAINCVLQQTVKPDKLVIFDDNDEQIDLRGYPVYSKLFQMLDAKGIAWEWQWAAKKGQHYNHQMANWMGYEWVWRVDDDCLPESNVLENLKRWAVDGVGAVGGAIITPPDNYQSATPTGLIANIDSEPNPQWQHISTIKKVEHMHCSFLYRAGIVDYHLGLSRVAHREETLFSYALHKKGLELLLVPDTVTWHLKAPGGIRIDGREEMYAKDEAIFRNFMAYDDKTIVVLNNGMGDHLVFTHVLPDIKNPVIFGCYPEIVPCRSIAEAQHLFGDLEQWNIYSKMDRWRWTNSLEQAFRKLYI